MSAPEGADPLLTGDAKQQLPDADELWYLSLNDSKPDTIVLLHGLGSSHYEWTNVWAHLGAYHLLLPDLPGHSSSTALAPCTIPAQAARVADLIRRHAHGGVAHLVGLSMGGFVAVETARTHPSLVRSAFVSGCGPFSGWRLWAARYPGVLIALQAAHGMLPAWVADRINDAAWRAQGLTVPDEAAREIKRNARGALVREVFGSIVLLEVDALRDVAVRTLAVVGGKMDDVEATRRQGAALHAGCAESRAVIVKEATHAWSLQFPELFGKGICAWIEGAPLPDEYVDLPATQDAE
ncbi:alpha/beta hydrolase fold-1 [Purpureocillium lavendulum]|uniref:Alpha/beta hydrolase fold-1 n=1 Tax=Purpureocillium lavendulum TaxID=1247861 RepID=A0AB34FQW1_9HYPO|nr:alpha/beta hydrolase fold-1 [Purpureocillium lavendulum]